MPIAPIKVSYNAELGLYYRKLLGKGGTAVGVARARDLANGRNLSLKTLKRMNSYFSRHEVDSNKIGFYKGEKGFPTRGRIAWDLWGGTEGWKWAKKELKKVNKYE